MRKLIIQIPCYNEEQTLGITLQALPRRVPGMDRVEWLIIDDGSTDRTVEVARQYGVDHILSLPRNTGLARAFMAGVCHSLVLGAEIIVNTDADNQYCAEDIPKLIEPILSGRAQIVVGARPIDKIAHFSRTKKLLQRVGSWVVRTVSGTDIADAPSGFRAFHRDAALQLNVFSAYTYTLETIIQAGHKGIPITSVPVRTNEELRPSRLVTSVPAYIRRSALTVARIFLVYRPLKFFLILGSIPFSAGFLLGVRWMYFFFQSSPRTRVPSLILTAILILIGVQIFMIGLVADLMAVNRRILEDIQVRHRRAELEGVEAPDGAGQRPLAGGE